MSSTLSLEARGIQKAFPGVLALQDVTLTMRGGSIHALLGENGAGKSTLIKIITGVYHPDEGELRLNGAPVRFEGPRDAIAAGVGVVHQERNLIPRFSVGENILLERLGGGLMRPIDYDAVHAEARRWLKVLELDLDPRTPVSQLNVAKVQLVEIAKALSLRSRVLLLDEPTASLTPQEAEVLFRLLRKLRDEGASLLFVSHKLEEVQQICDEVTVLRDGRNACPSRPIAGLGRQDLVRLMIGRNEQIPDWAPSDHSRAETMLALKNVSTALGHANIDLTVRRDGTVTALARELTLGTPPIGWESSRSLGSAWEMSLGSRRRTSTSSTSRSEIESSRRRQIPLSSLRLPDRRAPSRNSRRYNGFPSLRVTSTWRVAPSSGPPSTSPVDRSVNRPPTRRRSHR